MIEDIPSPIDFTDIEQAMAWTSNTIAKRPYRPRFFEAFCAALKAQFDGPMRIAELGSGPGHLARELLSSCDVETYCAIDFSPAMHVLAREDLKDIASRVRFVLADFRTHNWADGLGEIDAIVTMQAAHEVRHKQHLPLLLNQTHGAIRPGGVLLFSDHYAELGSTKNPHLFLTREEIMGLRSG